MPSLEKYGITWDVFSDIAIVNDYDIERECLQRGGTWEEKGKTVGLGLFQHFKNYWEILWPEDDQNSWTDLMLREVLDNRFTSIVGPASGWKSGEISRIALMDWSLFPECTTIIMSSTGIEDLKGRIFGETIMLWKRAKERFERFPGFCVDSKSVITNDDVKEKNAREIRNSIIGVACKTSSGKWEGHAKYSGRKNRRVWCIADEFQFMELSILTGQKNLVSNGDNLLPGTITEKGHKEFGMPRRGYKAVFISNPNPSRPGNPAEVISEPEKGWGSIKDDGKTKCWDAKQVGDSPVKCRVIQLDALDSPNSAYPIDKPRWDHMAGPHKVKSYPEGSESYWSQGRGIFKFGLALFKIITRENCVAHNALDTLDWDGRTPTTKIGMLDAAYGLGDRCALGWLEFGKCVDGKIRLLFKQYWLVPITIDPKMKPEQQIAMFCKDKMEQVGVLPENFGFDGRGSLAMALAEHWSPRVNSIEFGGTPSDRPAGQDIFTIDKRGVRRLKTENEHYSKFVTVLWWAWLYAMEADQIRGLPESVIADATPREWYMVNGDRIEIETKAAMKKRTGISPDLADMFVTGIEIARRRGFQIGKLAPPQKSSPNKPNWLALAAAEHARIERSHELIEV